MKIVEELGSVWKRIRELAALRRISRNSAEQKELDANIKSLCTRRDALRDQLKESDAQYRRAKDLIVQLDADAKNLFDPDPCQTPGCENTTDEHPTACTMCDDREVEHGV